ncbi:hypothetical protein BGZ98_006772 [Dissophora globulifera]|nr:hypothetical protein BGZ98_006772 [Dissophora globulifera]
MPSQVDPPIDSTPWDSQASTPSESPSSVLSEVDNRFCFTTTWDDEPKCIPVSAATRNQDCVGLTAIWGPSGSLPGQSSPPPFKHLELIHPRSFLPPVDDRCLSFKVIPTFIKEDPKVDARGSKWAKMEQQVLPAAVHQRRPYLGLEATAISAKAITRSAETAVASGLNASTLTPHSELHTGEGTGSDRTEAVKMAKFTWGGVDLVESAAPTSLTQDEKIDFIERGGTFSRLEALATPISEFRSESDACQGHKCHHLIKHQQRQQMHREDHHQNYEHRTKKIWYDREFLMRFKMYRIAPDGFVDAVKTLRGTVDAPMKTTPEDLVSSPAPTRSSSPHRRLVTGESAQHPRHSIGGNTNLTFAGIANSKTKWTPGAVTGGLGGRQFCFGKVREPVGPPPTSAKSTLSRGFRSRTQV